MTSRRSFLAGLGAVATFPLTSWADVGNPAYLSAARRSDGRYTLVGLSAQAAPLFEVALPARGHAAAAHPTRPHAVAFARRPGTFALVLDCSSSEVSQRIFAPPGRHFYGHGVFSADGRLLFTTENDFERAEGKIGVWDVQAGYRRIAEFFSGGVGAHDLKLMPDDQTLVVANGGIETHPDSGRAKLNIATMHPNLSYLSQDGTLREQARLPANMQKASIRHLSVRADGLVAVGCQWQGAKSDVPLMFTHRQGGALSKLPTAPFHIDLQGYIGSIAFSSDGQNLVATSPRGNVALLHDLRSGHTTALGQFDVCGVAPGAKGLVLTSGQGYISTVSADGIQAVTKTEYQWDNHLI
ncbi:DUF1513 domain-containing protein, partial [Cognatishimia sp. WU-CL00825]|uniref:DUF1513 domain-containing protein n=1 Tax=Cognatishimia sp. WU-CL00825 TaxID=3127658 RepID=UPI003365A3AE